jgi:uncharacterized protein (TIGR03118 family)
MTKTTDVLRARCVLSRTDSGFAQDGEAALLRVTSLDFTPWKGVMKMIAQSFRRWAFQLAVGMVCAAALPGSLRATNAYLVRNLVSDIPDLADFTDPNLQGPWGISESSGSPFWIANAGSGTSTLHKSAGNPVSLVVTIPPAPSAGGTGAPTGTVFNGSTGFALATGKAALFLFDTLDGTISGWNPGVDGTHSIIKVDNSSAGAIYTGLAIGVSGINTFLYAANLHSGAIDVFDVNFKPVSAPFKDPMIPAGYAPFNVQSLGGKLYVAYAQQNAGKNFANSGPGLGYVDVFDTAGNLLQHLIAGGNLNAPWGLAIAPAGFGDYANDLLVGNFGDGTINAFNPSTGAYIATLNDEIGTPIVVPGLWALQVGNGGSGGDASAVYFTAGIPGPDNGNHGLFGRLQAAPGFAASAVANAASVQAGIAPNTWISITGSNLASTTRSWLDEDFVNGALPTVIDGVSVTVGGKPAYISYVSPTQLNVLTPVGAVAGPAQVQTNNHGLTSATATVQVQAGAPAFFTLDGTHIAATHADGTVIGATAPAPSTSSPAKPGETIILYGNGFGPTNPPAPEGMVLTAPAVLPAAPTIKIGTATAVVKFAGLTGVGLYQFNVTIPPTTPDGDIGVVAQLGAQTTQSNAVITVQH